MTYLSFTFHRGLERAGLPRLRIHDLRHTAATHLLNKHVHPKVVQELLGHSTIAITLDTYSHVMPVLAKEASAQMSSLFPNRGTAQAQTRGRSRAAYATSGPVAK